uniref:EF-hand domain-containing protein n=1 Tax=Eucampia antarctica TaxID=49252 RepID=A0A7S2R5Y4_9STRA|mmetsp:Transcript_17320/g.16776  ORF Transcript_17320/g.16776 Transcript_17320/m.16776 type:complete len:258 (+) Transcript_17320:183-956(+)
MRCYYKQIISFLFAATTAFGQDYQDYQDYANDYTQQDNLYADYAMKQQDKTAGGGGGGGGMGKLAVIGGLSWFLGGKIHSTRVAKLLKKKHMKETKTLYSQYYNDVYKLQEQNAEMAYLVEQLQTQYQRVEQEREMEAIQRDYDEFKQPDLDGDEQISRAEFNMYVKNYLSNYPGLGENDYPKFEEFDHDGDGYVSFQEYAQQMAVQVKKAEKEKRRADQQGVGSNTAKQKAAALKGLYGDAKKGDSFNDLYANYKR